MEKSVSVKTPLKEPKHLDDFIEFGSYTVLICIMTFFVMLCQLSNTVYMVYSGAASEIIGCGNRTFSGVSQIEACKLLEECSTDEKPALKYQFYSVNIEWNHLCDEITLVKTSTSLQMVAVIIGSILFGQISDSFGRKWPIAISLFLCSLFGILTLFTTNLFQFTILRFLIGVFNGGHMTIITVYTMECSPSNTRMWINCIISWAPCVMLFGVIAFFLPNWRYLVIAVSVFTLPGAIITCFLHESPRWLVQKGRTEDAGKVIKSIRRISGNSDRYDDILDRVLLKEYECFQEKSAKKYSFHHLFSRKNLTIYSLVLSFSYFSTSLINYGFLFNLESLSGSIYLNSILMGAMRWAANLTGVVMDHTITSCGRKTSHFMCFIIIIGGIGTTIGLHLTGNDVSLKEVIRICVLFVFGCCGQLYTLNGVIINELIPTPLRTFCCAFTMIFSRGGVVMGPYVFSLIEFGTIAPLSVLLCLGITAALLFQVFIPECKNIPLIDHIEPRKKLIVANEEIGLMEQL